MYLVTSIMYDIAVEIVTRLPLHQLLIITLRQILDIAVVHGVYYKNAVVIVRQRQCYLTESYSLLILIFSGHSTPLNKNRYRYSTRGKLCKSYPIVKYL